MFTKKPKVTGKTKENDGVTLANAVVKKIKDEVTSVHDIISRIELPFIFAHKRNKYISRFGKDRFERYEKHSEMLNKICEKVLEVTRSRYKNIPCQFTTMNVALTMCGFGECSSVSNRALVELVAAGYKLPINIVMVLGKPRVPNPQNDSDYYEHVFIIIGEDISFNSASLEGFKQLRSSPWIDRKSKRYTTNFKRFF
jgi:hypothetical protein